MKINKVNHIGIAVNDIDEAVKLYTEVLGLEVTNMEVVSDQNAKTAIIPVGETKIELIQSTSPEGTIAKFIENKGEGLHHVALEVDDIKGALQTMTDKGVRLIDENPRKGVENTNIAFLHPKGTKILLELVEPGA
ncbi:methylmalonyl-CoA epimerase [Chloroflexota bacterium]